MKIIKNYFALTGETVVYGPVAGYDLTLADIRYRSYVNEEEKREKEQKLSKYEKLIQKTSQRIGRKIGFNLSLLEECIKEDKGDISSEKEQDARIVVNTYAVASATSGGALSFIPYLGAAFDNLSLAPKQRKLMVEDIADIYELNPKDKYIITRTLGLEDIEQINNFIKDSTVETVRALSEYIKKKAIEDSFTYTLVELSQIIGQIAPFIKAGLSAHSAKKIGEAVIDACKDLSRNY